MTARVAGEITIEENVLVNDEKSPIHVFKWRCEIREDFSSIASIENKIARWVAHADTADQAFLDAAKLMQEELKRRKKQAQRDAEL